MGWAEFELSGPADPSRHWGAGVTTLMGYNDNINTTPTALSSNRESSATVIVSPEFSLKYPGDQTSAQLHYAYNAAYYLERNTSKPDESHGVDASISHAFTPRLTTSVTDYFRRGLAPELVQQQISGTPLITRRRGDYTYNDLAGSVGFQASPRWSLNLRQSWGRWLFDDRQESMANDRDTYSTTLGTSYAWDTRTFVGGNCSFSLTDYSLANATNSLRDSKSTALYASLIHRFNPLIVGQCNAGVQLAGFDGATDLSPYVTASGSYNFGSKSLLTAGFSYNIQLTEVAVYRSANQAASFVSFHYYATPKLHASVDFAYVMLSYQNLNPLYRNPNDITQQPTATENSWRMGANVLYDFTPWASLQVSYIFDEVSSDLDNQITGLLRSYYRNQISAGLRFTY